MASIMRKTKKNYKNATNTNEYKAKCDWTLLFHVPIPMEEIIHWKKNVKRVIVWRKKEREKEENV